VITSQLNVGALDRFSQDIGAVRVQHGADLGAPGHVIGLVGIADLALGELFFKHLVYSVKLIEYAQQVHSLTSAVEGSMLVW
jgi:hypothetical protein